MRADTWGRAVAAARNSRLRLVLIVPGKRQKQIMWPGLRLSPLDGFTRVFDPHGRGWKLRAGRANSG
jgi:hypothetical protein